MNSNHVVGFVVGAIIALFVFAAFASTAQL